MRAGDYGLGWAKMGVRWRGKMGRGVGENGGAVGEGRGGAVRKGGGGGNVAWPRQRLRDTCRALCGHAPRQGCHRQATGTACLTAH